MAPLPFDLPAAKFDAMLNSLNGALITGGETKITHDHSPYMNAARKLYEHSKALHAKSGERGRCGVRVWACRSSPSSAPTIRRCSNRLPIKARTSSCHCSSRPPPPPPVCCARNACDPAEALQTLTTANVTVNLHHDGVLPSSFAPNTTLGNSFTVLSTNVDRVGKPFASTIEAKGGAPIWGVQWHPERPQFDYRGRAYNRSEGAIEAMFSLSARLVREARKSPRRFPDAASEAKSLIYNYRPVGDTSYEAYFF